MLLKNVTVVLKHPKIYHHKIFHCAIVCVHLMFFFTLCERPVVWHIFKPAPSCFHPLDLWHSDNEQARSVIGTAAVCPVEMHTSRLETVSLRLMLLTFVWLCLGYLSSTWHTHTHMHERGKKAIRWWCWSQEGFFLPALVIGGKRVRFCGVTEWRPAGASDGDTCNRFLRGTKSYNNEHNKQNHFLSSNNLTQANLKRCSHSQTTSALLHQLEAVSC